MITTAVKRLTFQEFEQMPEQPGKQELLDGELVELPPAKLKHNEIRERIYLQLLALIKELHTRNKTPHLGRVHMEMGYRIAGGWLVPDVSLTFASQKSDDYYHDAPALVIEIISNEKTADYIDKKIQLYFEGGATEVWVVYPNQRHAWIYRPGGVGEARSGTFQSELLAGANIDLSEILK